MQVRTGRRVQNKPHMLGGFRQTRLGQLAADKYGTVSAGLMREYDLHLEKAHKSLLAVARLRAGLNAEPHCDADAVAASRGDAMPRRPFVVGAGNLRKPVGRVGLGGPNAGLGGIGVGFFGAWRSYEGSVKTYRDMARIGIRGAWGSARHGLQCVICEIRDCRLCGFL